MKLRSHLITLVVGALAPVLVFSVAMVILFWNQERYAVEQGMRETARALAVAVERELESSVTAMEAFATARSLDSGNLAEFYDQAARVAASREAWQSIALVNPAGEQLIDTLVPFGGKSPARPADRSYIQQVVDTHRPAISDLIPGPAGKGHVVIIAVPVRRDGKLFYVLTVALDLKALERILQQQKIPDRWLASIIDRRKIIIARTLNADRFVGTPATPGLSARSAEMDEGWFREESPEGLSLYLAFSRSRLTGWTVTLGAPGSIVAGSLQRSLGTVAAAGVLFVLIGIALATRFGTRIAGPIVRLSRVAERLGLGEMPPPMTSPVSEVNEVGRALRDTGALLIRRSVEREEAAASARESEERMRFSLEAAQVGAWDWDLRTGRLTWSPALEVIHGLPAGTFVGTLEAYQKDIHPDDRERVVAALARAVQEEVEHDIEYRIVRPDGSARWVHGKGRVLRDAAGRPARMSGVCYDITARRHADDERARVLSMEQAARTEAERVNRAKDEFLATLSHELRTPLNALMGWARLLRSPNVDEATAARATEVIERNTRVLTQLVADLLDVSRIITGKLRLEVQPVAPIPVVEAAIDAVRAAAEAKEITIHTALDSSVGPLAGDPDRLQQIVWNLLSNAVKFTPAGGRIDIQLRHAGTHVELRVSDTGKGIRPDFLPYVFDRFRQADSTTTRRHGGLGLGLAIVRHLAELHGGTAHVDSAGDGLGASFTVRLPFGHAAGGDGTEAGTARKPEGEVAGPAGDGELPSLEGVRVLLVDDEADARELLTTLLERCGAHVKAAASADEALASLDLSEPDVLVSDIAMPGEDGYALIEKVRSRDAGQGRWLPAVALTAYARDEDRARALAAGYQLHVAKPVTPPALVRAVAALASRLRAV